MRNSAIRGEWRQQTERGYVAHPLVQALADRQWGTASAPAFASPSISSAVSVMSLGSTPSSSSQTSLGLSPMRCNDAAVRGALARLQSGAAASVPAYQAHEPVAATSSSIARQQFAAPPAKSLELADSLGNRSTLRTQIATQMDMYNTAHLQRLLDAAAVLCPPAKASSTVVAVASTEVKRRPRLCVTILSASCLKVGAEGSAKPHPYCICEVPGKSASKFSTRTTYCTVDPVWNHQREVPSYDEGDPLEFTIMDEEGRVSMSPDGEECLGKVTLMSNRFFPDGFDGELRLKAKKQLGSKAKLRIRIHVLDPGVTSGKKDPFCQPELLATATEPDLVSPLSPDLPLRTDTSYSKAPTHVQASTQNKSQKLNQKPSDTQVAAVDATSVLSPKARPSVKRRRALSIAINYTGQPGELQSAMQNQRIVCDLWMQHFGVRQDEILTLRDDDNARMPNRANIMSAMRWLVDGAQPGDALFFHYSGHGGQTRDRNGDDDESLDETLVPVDFRQAGMISDDDLRQTLVLPLPEGSSLFGLVDSCHSGSAMNLSVVVKMEDDAKSVTFSKRAARTIHGSTKAHVVMISSCEDSHQLSELKASPLGNLLAANSPQRIQVTRGSIMIKAFQHAITTRPNGSFHWVLKHMREYHRKAGYAAVPQMSSEQMLKLDAPLIFGPQIVDAIGAVVPVPGVTDATSRRKALSIAINYIGQDGELQGCINDQHTICQIWIEQFGVRPADIVTLRDDDPNRMPTLANIMAAMKWLVQGVAPKDALFFHYSGHGGQDFDTSGDECDCKDETLIPVDHENAGMLRDDTLRQLLVLPLPEGASLFGLMDCCHSGTGMDLPFVIKMKDDGTQDVTVSRKHHRKVRGVAKGNVLMISGCKDNQCSADAYIGAQFSGAMTQAFNQAVKTRPRASFHWVLRKMRNYLKLGGYSQIPQMSSEHMLKIDAPFLHGS